MTDSSCLGKLPPAKRQELLDDLNYLNMAEIKSLCKRCSIPFKIVIRTERGEEIATKDEDRKGVVLSRIRHFLTTGVIPGKTYFPFSVVSSEPLPEMPKASDRLFYGQYDKENRAMADLLKVLTGGKFRHGAIARILAREFWSKGEAPTFAAFAAAWMEASERHNQPNPEWAFLSDRSKHGSIPDWKTLRDRKAAQVLQTLSRLDL